MKLSFINKNSSCPGCLAFFILLALAALFSSPCAPAWAHMRPSQPILYDFRQIPGVTPEETAAIEALQKKYSRLTYGMMNTTETFIGEDGRVGGYSALFCDWISRLFGITFEPRIYDWKTLTSGFESGKIAFTGELSASPERRKKYFMTGTFTTRAIKAFRLKNNARLDDIAKTRPLRYVFLKDTTTIKAVLASSEYPVQAILVATEREGLEKLHSGQADAFLAESHGAAIFGDDIIGEDIFPVVYSPIVFSTAVKELQPIISVFDKYLKSGAVFHLINLYNQGDEEYLRHNLLSRLSAEEKAYLRRRRQGGAIVPVTAEFDNYPVSFYNAKEKEWQGIAIDVLKRIQALTGLNFQIVNRPGTNWAALFAMLENGQAAMATEVIFSNDRKDRYLWADQPYTVDYYALLSCVEQDNINIKQVLYSRIGLIAGSAYASVFREWFPDHKDIREFPSPDDAFRALETGEIDFLMGSRNLLLSATNYHDNPAFKANLIFDRTYGSSFGFNKDEKLLRSIVSKAQELTDTRIIADRWTRKVFDYRSKLARAQAPYLFGAIGLLLCVMLLLLILFLKSRQMGKKLELTVRQRTRELRIQTEKARTASQAKGDFLSRMSHEIRTPLNAIMGMAQIAKRSAGQEARQTVRAIDEMLAASRHLLAILNDVLDISKIEAGKFTLTCLPFSFRKAMGEVESIIGQRCREKNILFKNNAPQMPDLTLLGDKLHLNQVLINLLGNAVKFTPDGGAVELEARMAAETPQAATIDFTVRDSGIGMSAEQTANLFKPFAQANANIASRFGGTGLGLAISQSLVRQMGGLITVQSEKNVGSSFNFTLTLAKTAQNVDETEPPDIERLDLRGKRILLVEDIAINRLIVSELLLDTFVLIDQAANGEEAVRLFENSPEGYYSLIFMDIRMPVMDGLEAAKRIRSMPRRDAATVRIIAMTANAYREDILKSFEAGMNGHISKPIDLDEVKRVLAGIA